MANELGINHLEFKFKGHFSVEIGNLATMKLASVFDNDPDMTYSLVWDFTEMSGFNAESRRVWYRCLKLYKPRIIDVVVISRSVLIRSVTKVMLEFFGIGSRIVKSKSDLFANV